MKPSILIAIFIVLVLICLWFLAYYNYTGSFPKSFSDTKDFIKDSIERSHIISDKPTDIYTKMSGYDDSDPVKNAISTLQKKESTNSHHESKNKISKKRKNEVAVNSFLLAELSRFSNTDEEQTTPEIADYYTRTLGRIYNDPYQIMLENDLRLNHPSVNTMLDRIQDYTNPPEMPVVRERVRSAKVKQKGKKYFQPEPIRSDPQNVHETQIGNDLARIYTKIVESNSSLSELPSLHSIRSAAQKHNFASSKHKSRALSVLDAIESRNSTISVLGARESDVVRNVWARINSDQNSENQSSLKTAFMDSLTDSAEINQFSGDYHVVCTTGRVSRVLGCLTLLDSDKTISEPVKTKEIMRNEAFAKAAKILESNLKKAPVEVSELYKNPSLASTPETDQKVAEFESLVKKKIEKYINKYYSEKMPEHQLRDLILDAQAGI